MKKFNCQYNVGKTKYSVNYHDGVQKHEDGSEFFGIAIFRNKKKFNKFISQLRKDGYTEETRMMSATQKFLHDVKCRREKFSKEYSKAAGISEDDARKIFNEHTQAVFSQIDCRSTK